MSWSVFHLFSAGMLTFLIMLVVLPFWWQRATLSKARATNVALIRQRLEELSREASEGLISERDQRQASDELKLALVDEYSENEQKNAPVKVGLIILFAVFAFIVGGYVYLNVNQLEGVQRQQDAVSALPELSAQLAKGEAAGFTTKDVQNLAIAIRHRLRQEPADAKGWMFLGRLNSSLGREDQALQALEKAFSISDDVEIASSYVRALLATGQRPQIARAQRILQQLIIKYPQINDYSLMMAVASAQLGDLRATRAAFETVRALLPEDNTLRQDLEQRIQQMENPSGQSNESESLATVAVAVKLGQNINSQDLPENGFLIVFAQSKTRENRMPAAVVKLPLPEFPVTVILSDENAMVAGYTLSMLKEAQLVARISADEDVSAAAGDLEGRLNVSLNPGNSAQYTITIDKEL
ncbi:c-type cytochrome biogenesis protein CcmI [Salinimonas chungwhensis]|uniref:c-type cytochrome biogenesis protein CcmI n=1 Tax=Salinimonas chungwhensis TaxID=265425 RepID=UPI000368B1BA|nr:c-type cytochrome biogenesis protein CcmI [Salinimonas chungwhensis]